MIQGHVPSVEKETLPLTISPHDIYESYGSVHVAYCSNGPAADHSGSPKQNPNLIKTIHGHYCMCKEKEKKQSWQHSIFALANKKKTTQKSKEGVC